MLVVSAGVLVVLGVNFTIRTMTGLNDDFIYEPSSMVTNRPI